MKLTLWTCSLWLQLKATVLIPSQIGLVSNLVTPKYLCVMHSCHMVVLPDDTLFFQRSPTFLTLLRINSLKNLSLSLLHFYHLARFTKNLGMCNSSDKDENVMSSCFVDVLFVWHFLIFFSSFINHMFWFCSLFYSKLWI